MDLDHVGKYKILGKIGQGAMGEVFRAQDPILNRQVAIKTMSAAISSDDELRKRFLREAQSAARLNHPNIITLYDFGEDQGHIYMAMELLDGHDLKDLIGHNALTDLGDQLDLMEQICDGLGFAHTMEVVHRDLKPANIHVQPSGQVKIMDFGLARLGASDMTRSGMVMGTPNYMSPEQVRGQRADSRSDIFSLGAVFYELLTNHKAFDAESLHAVLFQVLENEPDPVRNWCPDLPGILIGVVEKALQKDPALRFQNAVELREALRVVRQVLAGEVEEDAVLASLLEAPPVDATIVNPPPDAEVTQIGMGPSPGGQVAGTAALKSSGYRGKTFPGTSEPTLSGRAPTRVGSTSGSTSGSASGSSSEPGSGGRPASGVRPGSAARPGSTARPGSGSRPGSGARPGSSIRPGTEARPATAMRPGSGARMGSAASRADASASGAGQTYMPEHAAAPASRMPMLIGGGLALLVAGGVGAYFAFKPGPPPLPPSTVAQGQNGALTEALVGTQLDLARKTLEFRDYKGAIATIEKALKLDPKNADALQIREKAQAMLDDLEASANEARAAVQAGDSDRASKALAKVMSIDPNHPVAAELSKQLDSRFKGQAEDGRRSMKRAAMDAEKARASGLAEFAEANTRAREAEALFLKSEFTGATQKFLEARDGFDRARRTALDRAATPPPTTMAQVTLPPATQPPATLPPTTAPPVTAAPVTVPPVTAPATTQPANEEPAVRRVIESYRQALERKDIGLFKTLKPNMSGDEERKLRAAFDGIKSQEISLSVTSVQLDGATATVRVSRRGTINGQAVPAVQQTFVLTKGAGGWTIRDIGQ